MQVPGPHVDRLALGQQLPHPVPRDWERSKAARFLFRPVRSTMLLRRGEQAGPPTPRALSASLMPGWTHQPAAAGNHAAGFRVPPSTNRAPARGNGPRPRFRKISGIRMPTRFSISASESTKRKPSSRATRRRWPILPTPMKADQIEGSASACSFVLTQANRAGLPGSSRHKYRPSVQNRPRNGPPFRKMEGDGPGLSRGAPSEPVSGARRHGPWAPCSALGGRGPGRSRPILRSGG